MLSRPLLLPLLASLALTAAAPALAQVRTICTITVNSSDEKDTFRERLPKGQFRFVELVEKGRPDWLRSACERGVQCDALVVSGHFNAGDDFYSDRLENDEYLRVDELERAACSESCPGVFSKLKEVYLFGCESLNPSASHNGSGESSRERMRRIFAKVPVIYGFSSSAPVGPTAAMLLDRYFDTGAQGEIASGRPSSRLLAIFARNSMTRAAGVREGEALAHERAQVCRFFDERQSAAQKLRYIHALMRRDIDLAGTYFPRIEKLFASLGESERQAPAFVQALAEISADEQSRERFLALARSSNSPTRRARMVALAHTLGWLTPESRRAELAALVNDLLARSTLGFADVDLVCSLNADRQLEGDAARVKAPARPIRATHAAALACLGDREAHLQTIAALAGGVDRDVQAAQTYLRHRPLQGAQEIRDLAREIARMPSSAPQVRALETLARLHVSDREVFEELVRIYAAAKTVQVQRAIAEVFIRSDPAAIPKPDTVSLLRQHRIKSPGGGEDLIDVLIRQLQGS